MRQLTQENRCILVYSPGQEINNTANSGISWVEWDTSSHHPPVPVLQVLTCTSYPGHTSFRVNNSPEKEGWYLQGGGKGGWASKADGFFTTTMHIFRQSLVLQHLQPLLPRALPVGVPTPTQGTYMILGTFLQRVHSTDAK